MLGAVRREVQVPAFVQRYLQEAVSQWVRLRGGGEEGAGGGALPDEAVNATGQGLRVLFGEWRARDPKQFGKKHRRRELPFEQKESVKWLRSLEAVARVEGRIPLRPHLSPSE